MLIVTRKRAVACKGWRWMPGMLVVASSGRATSAHRVTHDSWSAWGGELPDLNDPATVGCLLALVRAEWGDPGLYCEGMYVPGGVGTTHFRVRGSYHHGAAFRRAAAPWRTSEAAALVAMLEAAERKP